MYKEDLFFKKVEGGVNKDMHGCAYENCDCTCKLTETYGTCIYKSNVGKCTYVPFEAEILIHLVLLMRTYIYIKKKIAKF